MDHSAETTIHVERPKRKYCLKKDQQKHKDAHPLHTFRAVHVTLPPKVDLRPLCPAVYDQGDLGSCTANAIAGAYEFDEMKQKEKTHFTPSRLFIYYNERDMEGDIADDNGASIGDGVTSTHTNGVCLESLWPYDIKKFAVKPTVLCYTSAKKHQSNKFNRIAQSLVQIKTSLAQNTPVMVGITLYDSFESDAVAANGVVHMPQPNENCLGGHAVLIVGYDDSKQCFIMRNSWGAGWGDHGYFYLPYAYILDPKLADDFWVILDVKDM